jgi:hypothetical protein
MSVIRTYMQDISDQNLFEIWEAAKEYEIDGTCPMLLKRVTDDVMDLLGASNSRALWIDRVTSEAWREIARRYCTKVS